MRPNSEKILLLGLGEELGRRLEDALRCLDRCVYSDPFPADGDHLTLIRRFAPTVVFCAVEALRHKALLESARQATPPIPVVIVSRHPDTGEWLDAIEAGAADYCAPPFETAHIQWVLESACKHRPVPM